MAHQGRNAQCQCGSGLKAKRCCGLTRGPGPADLARAFLAEQRRWAATSLRRVSESELEELLDEMLDLPAKDVSLQLRLPRLLTPALEALRVALDEDDDEAVDELAPPALAELDDPERRAQLAEAVLALVDQGRVDRRLAAVAVVDLARDRSALLRASLLEALAVSVGAVKTPAGLLVVSR